MTVQPQPLAIQFAGGIETKQDSKQVPSVQLLNLENGMFIKRTTIAKRNGYAALSRQLEDGSEYDGAIGMAKRGSELLLFNGERCYSYRPSTDRWADTGEVASITATERPIARTGTAQTVPDHATNGGVTVVAWEDSRGGVYCSVVEADGGRILLAETLLDADAISPRCVAAGTVLHVYYAVAASAELWCAVINPVAPEETPVPVVLTNDLSTTNPVYDATDAAIYYPTIAPAIMAWADTAGGYRVSYVHPSGVLGSPVTGLPSAGTWADAITGPIAIETDRINGSALALGWCSTVPNVRWISSGFLSDDAGTVAVSATIGTWKRITVEPVLAADGGGGASRAWWAAELVGARDDLNIVECGEVDGTLAILVASTSRRLRGHGLVSRAFIDNGEVYAIVGHSPEFFTYTSCVRISGDSFGGDAVTPTFYRSDVGQFPGLSTRKHLSSVQPVDPNNFGVSRIHAACIGYRIQLDGDDGNLWGETGIKLATLDFDADISYQTAELGRGLYLAGACMAHYDGNRWAEAEFHCAPDVADGVTYVAEGAAGAIGAGTYNYRIAYEEVDAQGELHQGAASVAVSVVNVGSKKINVTIPTYRLTSKKRVRIGVYRSPANQTGEPDSIPYYRVSSVDPNDTGDNGYVLNDPTADTVSFVDNLTDALLIGREPMYTNGGILSNDPSPMAGGCITGGKGRLFWTDATDPHLVRYSQERLDETGMEGSVALSVQADSYGGPLVGIGVMDRNVFAFAEDSIYGFTGPGPLRNPNAGEESFSPVDLVTSDVGCVDPNSICQSPEGIVFKSAKGFRLLDRSNQVQDIGAAVYGLNDQRVTRSTLLPDRSQIVFLTDSGYTLLWDYERRQWSKFTNHEGYDATVIDGVYYYLRTDGRVFYETPGVFTDDGRHIVLRIETAWLRFAEYLQGWQRVLWAYFLGTYKSEHTLRVRYRIDYNEAYSESVDLDVDSNNDPSVYGAGVYGEGPYGGPGGDTARYQRAIHFNLPCQAISFRVEDVEQTDDYGASFELSELLLIGGMMDYRFKPGPARTN